MISKKNRLTRLEVEVVKKIGRIKSTPNATFLVLPSDTTFTKIGIVISKKVLKSAVNRNQYKRVIFNLFKSRLEILPHQHILLILKKNPLFNKNQIVSKINKELDQIWVEYFL